MLTAPRIVGNHVFIFRDGDALNVNGSGPGNAVVATPANAGRNVKPAANDTGWIDVGVVNNLGISLDGSEVEIFAPTPGQLRLFDVLETKRKLGVKFDCEELSKLAYELMFGTLPLNDANPDADVNYNPLAGPVKKAWMLLQQYDQNDVLINTVYCYAHLKVGGEVKFDDNNVKTAIEVKVLHSVLNAGTIKA